MYTVPEKMLRSLWLIVPVACSLVSCGKSEKQEAQPLPPGVGIDLHNMDTTVRPGDDFYQYVNGGWLAKTTIPSDEGRWGGFYELVKNTQFNVLSVVQEAAEKGGYQPGSDQKKVIDFFKMGMDSVRADRLKDGPLATYYKDILAIQSREHVINYLTLNYPVAGNVFFSLQVTSDMKASDKNVLYVGSGGLGLPEKDYYLKQDEKSKETRSKYLQHMVTMLQLSGLENSVAQAQAKDIFALETKLAAATMAKEDRRNMDKIYNKRSMGELAQMAPSFEWARFFDAINAKKVDSVVVADIRFVSELENIFKQTPLPVIKSYLRWHLLSDAAPYLSASFVEEDFAFYGAYLRGVTKMKPRWKRVLAELDKFLGEAVGQLYVEKYFPQEAKQKALEMVDNIRLAFAERIKKLDWMSDSTKSKALDKLKAFQVKIGYPDQWKDYAGLAVTTDSGQASYIENIWNAERFSFRREISKLGKPADRKEWLMPPQMVNAYYNPSYNEIVFPAAILQPPFFDYRADDAINYGGIGAVIGHEISHGFDDQGSKFDGNGNKSNWWTAEDLSKFQEKGKALAEQFNKYEPLPGVFVQGEFTLGENIGDLGGVAMAYDGLQRKLREHGRVGMIDGFTPEQRFFISWATIWRTKIRDESLRVQVMSDPHAPGMYRAIGPLTNFSAFYDAFGITPAHKMFKREEVRVQIW